MSMQKALGFSIFAATGEKIGLFFARLTNVC
jgi:hypothetical protein